MMPGAFQVAAVIFCVLGALEGVRSLALLRSKDPEAAIAASAAAMLCSFGLFFVVLARIDG